MTGNAPDSKQDANYKKEVESFTRLINPSDNENEEELFRPNLFPEVKASGSAADHITIDIAGGKDKMNQMLDQFEDNDETHGGQEEDDDDLLAAMDGAVGS